MRTGRNPLPSSPAPPQRPARGPVFRVPASVPLSPYEDSVLKQLRLPYFLPYRKEIRESVCEFHFLPPGGWQALTAVDRGRGQSQENGIRRLNMLLCSMREARRRMLSPSFHALALGDLWLNSAAVAFPLLPLGKRVHLAGRADQHSGDFWAEWRSFYHAQNELGELGAKLCRDKAWEQLHEIFAGLGQCSRPRAEDRPAVSRAPVPPRPARSRPAAGDTLPLLPPPAEYRIAVLREVGKDEKATREALLWESEYLIGRDPALCDLCLEESWVGRLHARLERRGGYWSIKDFSSRNGTYVNGRRLHGEEVRLLPRRCLLGFGRSSFEFSLR